MEPDRTAQRIDLLVEVPLEIDEAVHSEVRNRPLVMCGSAMASSAVVNR